MDTQEQRGLVVRLCGLVHALVNEVEAEREQLLDAQGSLAEVVQRLVRQDEAWKDRNGHLEVQERAIRELATSNAKLRTTLMRQQRTPVHRPHSAAAKQQQRGGGGGGGGRWQLGELEAAAAARPPHTWQLQLDSSDAHWLVSSPVPVEGRTGARATPPPPDDDPKLRVYGAPKFCARRSDTEALPPSSFGHGALSSRGVISLINRRHATEQVVGLSLIHI